MEGRIAFSIPDGQVRARRQQHVKRFHPGAGRRSEQCRTARWSSCVENREE